MRLSSYNASRRRALRVPARQQRLAPAVRHQPLLMLQMPPPGHLHPPPEASAAAAASLGDEHTRSLWTR